MPSAENGLRAEVERVLRENGLTDRPDRYDSSIHSWRCEHPDRYGPCSCFAELVDDLTRVLSPGAVVDPRDGEVCCSNPASCAGTAGPGTEGCHISPGVAE